MASDDGGKLADGQSRSEFTQHQLRRSRRWRLAWLLLLAVCCFWLLLPVFQAEIGPRRRSPCVNNLKQIGMALQNYHDKFKCFPPAYLADKDGNPIHSWRVLILPYLEEPAATAVYDQYHFDEPWDGPNNRLLADKMPPIYRDPDSKWTGPSYLAVIGEQSIWPADRCTKMNSIRGGTSNTIALVEVADAGIHWMEPRDLTFEQAAQGINPPLTKLAISSIHRDGANCLFADGFVHFVSDKIPKESLRGLLTINGGESASIDDEEKPTPNDPSK